MCVCVCGLTVRRRGQIGLPPLPLYCCGRRLNRTTSFLSYSEPASFLLSDYLSLGSPLFFFYFHFLFPSIFISISILFSLLLSSSPNTHEPQRHIERTCILLHITDKQTHTCSHGTFFFLSLFVLFRFSLVRIPLVCSCFAFIAPFYFPISLYLFLQHSFGSLLLFCFFLYFGQRRRLLSPVDVIDRPAFLFLRDRWGIDWWSSPVWWIWCFSRIVDVSFLIFMPILNYLSAISSFRYLNVSHSGPLYRLPCSSTMSTYVPAAMTTSPGSSNQQHQHQHRPSAVGFNDVRPSSSFQSFNSGGVGEGSVSGVGGGVVSVVPSLYSLSDAHCSTSVAMMSAEANGLGSAISNGDHLSAAHRQEMNRSCHHLYWSRPPPRMPSVISSNSPGDSSSNRQQHQQHLIPVRMPGINNQGSVDHKTL